MTTDAKKRVMLGNASAFTGLGMLCQIAALLQQSYWFLKSGEWWPLPTLEYLGRWVDAPWLSQPDKWLGVHKILNSLNLGTTLMLVCLFIAVAIAGAAENNPKA